MFVFHTSRFTIQIFLYRIQTLFLNIFCKKTTVLAEKVFHPAAGEAQLKFLSHVKFTLSSWIVNSSFVIKSSKKTLPLAEAKRSSSYCYVLKLLQSNPEKKYGFRPIRNHRCGDNDRSRLRGLENQQAERGKILKCFHYPYVSFRSLLRKQPDHLSASQPEL